MEVVEVGGKGKSVGRGKKRGQFMEVDAAGWLPQEAIM